ncbi:MAG: hypothetical protein WCH39_08840 [Schlesneria sp.]
MSFSNGNNDDLPPRSWKSWWNGLPGWFRIGFWAVFASAVLQVAIILRIIVGLTDPYEVSLLRQRGAGVGYASNFKRESFPGSNLISEGLRGRSRDDVYFVQLREKGTDEDLKLIAARFPNLRQIHLLYGVYSVEGLKALSACRKLEHVSLDCTDADDAVVESLSKCEMISHLSLERTLVSDAAIPALERLPRLKTLVTYETDISFEAIQELRASRGKLQVLAVDTIVASIRWSDGKRSRRFQGAYKADIKPAGRERSSVTGSSFDFRDLNLLWSDNNFRGHGDGDYVFTLQLGDYESEHVTIPLKNGSLAVRSVEFQMPVTEAEALRSKLNGKAN